MADQTVNKMRLLVLGCLWLCIFGAGVLGYRLIFKPRADQQATERAQQERNKVLQNTSSNTRFKNHITANIDSFSGYAILRSDEFRDELASRSISMELVDDNADYNRRLADLASGKCQMAAFTVDALIKASGKLESLPATIVFVIDESRGADAMVGVSRTLPNVDALNDPATKFVITPDSPSETLSRVVMAHFNLDRLEKDPWIYAKDAKGVYDMYRKHQPNDKKIFVLWEPYISKMAQNPDYKVIVDSSKFRGYIVDVWVVNRDFLIKNPQVVRDVSECYFRTLYRQQTKLSDLLVEDSRKMGEPLKVEEVRSMIESTNDQPPKIWLKNTRENWSHFGLNKSDGLQHIEDIISNLTKVLIKTGAIQKDPTNGQPNLLYYDAVLKQMASGNFHPGDEKLRSENSLVAITEDDWNRLEPVGTLEVPKLVFARGTSRLTANSESILTDLASKLENFPQYYLLVRGNASKNGDLEANKVLAMDRAESTKRYLVGNGIVESRIKAVAGEPSGETTVSFVLGQLPY